MLSLTVAVVSYNARAEILRALEALHASTTIRPLEVIVTDNASSDGSAAAIEESFPEVQLLRNEENVGFARAANRSWREGRGDCVLFLNSDAIVQPGAVERMVGILEARPEVGAVGPRLLNEDGSVQISFGRMLSLGSELLQKCRDFGYAGDRGILRASVERAHAREREVDWVSGACMLTRRALLERLDGFDEAFFMYSEDVDLCARIRAAGARVLFTPEAEVVHLRGRSSGANRERVLYESQRSRLYFYGKHHGPVARGLLRCYMAAKAATALVLRPDERALHQKVLRLALTGGPGYRRKN